MKLKEAERVLNDWNKAEEYTIRDEHIDDMSKKLYIERKEAIETVLQALEELQKENEKLKEIDLTTVFMQGACDEKTRWKQKIKKKIQELKIEEKTRLKGKGCFDRCLILSEYQYKENVLQELLKEE